MIIEEPLAQQHLLGGYAPGSTRPGAPANGYEGLALRRPILCKLFRDDALRWFSGIVGGSKGAGLMWRLGKESYRTLQVGVVLWVTAGVSALFADPAPVTVKVTSGQSLEVQALAPGIFRVRLGPSAVFAPSLQERYGVVRTDWSGVPVETRSTTDTVTLRTAYGDLRMDKASGNIALRDHEGRVVSPEIRAFPFIM